jgi:hypothetical protein
LEPAVIERESTLLATDLVLAGRDVRNNYLLQNYQFQIFGELVAPSISGATIIQLN